MNPKEKAKELVEKFIPNVYCYLGSGMLTNEYSEEVALVNAKKQALVCVNEIIISGSVFKNESNIDFTEYVKNWRQVKQEIERYGSISEDEYK